MQAEHALAAGVNIGGLWNEIQGLLRSPRAANGAPQDGVRCAYRKLARKENPDVSQQADSEDRFKGWAWPIRFSRMRLIHEE